jgi:ribosomal protein S21
MINVKVTANSNENGVSLLRRFSRRVQGSGIMPKAKSLRFRNRNTSDFLKKKKRLNSISKKTQIEKMIKLGKIPPKRKRRY